MGTISSHSHCAVSCIVHEMALRVLLQITFAGFAPQSCYNKTRCLQGGPLASGGPLVSPNSGSEEHASQNIETSDHMNCAEMHFFDVHLHSAWGPHYVLFFFVLFLFVNVLLVIVKMQ